MTISVCRTLIGASTLALLASGAIAQDRGLTYTTYGTPGLIEMPSALVARDGQISSTLMLYDGGNRANFTFQITPRLMGSFRYSGIQDINGPGNDTYDRSFDLRYQIRDEGEYWPAIAIGLQDFMGTGLFSGEYVVATKTFGDSFRVTAGLGWGRLASYNGFDNPLSFLSGEFDDRGGRPAGDLGGRISFNSFFRGDAAFFGGVEWAPNDRWLVKLEYSSDDSYYARTGEPLIEHRTPINVGVVWRPNESYQVGLSYLNGSEFVLTGTLLFNPHDRPFAMGLDNPPVPVTIRTTDTEAALSWGSVAQNGGLEARISDALAADGFDVRAIEITESAVRIRYTNSDYRSEAQALGRISRLLTGVLPTSVETITLEPMQRGIPLSAVTFRRNDIETLENAPRGTELSFRNAVFTDAGPDAGLQELPQVSNPFTWGISPYLNLTLFGANEPVAFDVGLEASARYEFNPNLVLSGAVRYRLTYRDWPGPTRWIDTHPVRRFTGFYAADGAFSLRNLQLSYYDRPGSDLYSRVTVGYLERMFGGVSAELLYKPVDSRWAVGVELNHTAQRSTDGLFGFGDYCHIRDGYDHCAEGGDPSSPNRIDADYATTTGHLSFYYAFDNGFHTQLDVGRYLAGDWGATISVDREFENGWRVGAYATFTDMPFEEFGEGSFDKGIRITVPFDFLLGTPSRREASTSLASLTRDGGARLDVDGRLYDFVREGHMPVLEDSWGRFWR